VEEPQTLYKQTVTHFTLPLYLRSETEVGGRLIVEVAEAFLSDLVFPGCRLTDLYTKRAGPPEERVHAVPVAYVGNDIEGNLASLYCKDLGIKGAFWASFLSALYVAMAGGEETLRRSLNGMRVDRLSHGGLLVVATDTPLPDNTEATREQFARLHTALRPAFLSREATPDNRHGMLGYFYRERPYGGTDGSS